MPTASDQQGQSELDRMSSLLYAELKRIAANHLRMERRGHTLQPTALVHEVYLRLVQCDADMGQRSRASTTSSSSYVFRDNIICALRLCKCHREKDTNSKN